MLRLWENGSQAIVGRSHALDRAVFNNDLEHVSTPPGKRGAEWWLCEHHRAEMAVTSAAAIRDNAKTKEMARFGCKLLDYRLDHLELVEDVCDAILCELRKQCAGLADVCERRFIKGMTWRAAKVGTAYEKCNSGTLSRSATRALKRVTAR